MLAFIFSRSSNALFPSKRNISAVLPIFLCIDGTFLPCFYAPGRKYHHKVNDNRHNFQGWGTSICWWGNIIGKYPEKTRDTILGLVFDTSSGLGLNIIRYNIGGGDAPSHNHMGVGKEMEGFLSEESATYDWTKDAGQRFFRLNR
jgi:hypothetical protein